MASRPWLKWYPADWRAESKLRMVSRAARSLWLDLIGLMHEAEPYGHLLINGKQPTEKQIAAVLGDLPRDITRWMAELDEAGVMSRTDDGVIYSRRMLRDRSKEERDRENGKGGGNPTLKGGVNPPDNRVDKAHIPEAIFQSKKQKPSPAFADEFERDFWPLYPRKEAKPRALKAFVKARHKAELPAILAGVRALLAKGLTEQYTPHPATWLNDERWRDVTARQAAASVAGPLAPDVQAKADAWALRNARHQAKYGTCEDGKFREFSPEIIARAMKESAA